MNEKIKRRILEWSKTIAIALTLAYIVRNYIFVIGVVAGSSMQPTLNDNEIFLVNRLTDVQNYERGDIIVLKDHHNPKRYYVKRLIGLPGDIVSIHEDIVYVNGRGLIEPYLKENRKEVAKAGIYLMDDLEDVKLSKDTYFVMGDNRLFSLDSRNGLGYFKKEDIVGKLLISF